MAVSLNGIIFDQVYGDNSGGDEFDTDGDGTATQEDEFISFTNTTDSDIDISGWQIWVDQNDRSAGAEDKPIGGLYHTFDSGTVLSSNDTLYVINEITGSEKNWQQESSEGGEESGAGGVSTNFLSEGFRSGADSVALVNPDTGEYIIFNMGPVTAELSSVPGFPGTTVVGEVDGDSIQDDYAAGYSYQYDSNTSSYIYDAVYVPCFASGTLIETDTGPRPIESLRAGDMILTKDDGFQPLRFLVVRQQNFRDPAASHKKQPIEFKPGSLGKGLPYNTLRVSPNHCMLWRDLQGREHLVPAKAFVDHPKVRQCCSVRKVTYCHLVFDKHQIVQTFGVWSESFLLGSWSRRRAAPQLQRALAYHAPDLHNSSPARALQRVQTAKALLAKVRHG